MIGFQDWLRILSQDSEVATHPEMDIDRPSQPEPEPETPVEEDTVLPDVSMDKDDIEESRPYTRSLRYYPSITPPTGGGPNFQYIAQDALASANSGKKTAEVPPHPGQDKDSIKKNIEAWKSLSGMSALNKKK